MKTLKNVLLINALSSCVTGLLLVVSSPMVARIFGSIQTMPFILTGIFLIVFALFVFSQSRKNPLRKNGVKLIIALDILWVIESIAVIISKMFAFTLVGYMLIGAVAIWVALMAILQFRGLKALSSANA